MTSNSDHCDGERFFNPTGPAVKPFSAVPRLIGAYEPRWFMHTVHMNPAEAVQAHLDLESAEASACTSGRSS